MINFTLKKWCQKDYNQSHQRSNFSFKNDNLSLHRYAVVGCHWVLQEAVSPLLKKRKRKKKRSQRN